MELQFNASIYSDLKTAGSGYLYLQPTGARVYVAEASLANSVYVYDYSGTNTAHSRLNAHNLLLEDDSGNTTAYVAGDGVSYLNGGNVGIGDSSPSYPLDVNGDVRATDYLTRSDIRLKRDVAPLDTDALGLIQKLKPVTFSWKEATSAGMRGRQIGFIAQDVQTVVPNLVVAASDPEKTLSVKYDEFVPVLTKAIQQQQAEIEGLKANNRRQAALINHQAGAIKQLQAAVAGLQHQVRIHTASK